ncbi:hypothetical protein HA466_0271700 [Hirschfeldia incana]|nr:hypothetical protein HA466_0271700 [Hirschfeldia incana]
MAPSTGNASNDRRRPRSPSLNLPDVRRVRPTMSTESMPPSSAQPTRPPGTAAPPTSSSVSAAPPTYVRRTEDALLRAPSRINQPHLHPDKINGALWIGIDPEVHEFIKATWQADYWGPWPSWIKVPLDTRTSWWHSFIQQYYWEDRFHDEIHSHWKRQTQVTISGRLSQKKKHHQQPSYISVKDWETILAIHSTPAAKAKSKKASASRRSAPPKKKMHVHGAGPRTFANIAYKMVVEEGFEAPISYLDLVRRTHSHKDGTFMDERAESIILEVEEAVDEMLQEGSTFGDSETDTTTSKRLLLNQEYIKRGQTSRGTIYGLGNLQYQNKGPSESVPAALKRNNDMEMRVSGLESITQEVKSDVNALKADVHALKTDFNEATTKTQSTLNSILQLLQPQSSAAQPSQRQSPSHSQAQSEGQGQAPSPAQDQPQAPGHTQPQHPITDNPSALDRWCNAELGM